MAFLQLNSGYKMPLTGYGTWKIPHSVCAQQVYDAVGQGYRLFDCAQDYANEKQVGEGLARAMRDGLVTRDELFVILKLWNSYHHPDHVEQALDRTLADLQLDYLDIFMMHFPIAFKFVPFEEKYPASTYCGDGDKIVLDKVPILDTWRVMESMIAKGKAKSIGISNFNGSNLIDLLAGARVPPAVLQIEHHPYLQQPRLVQWAQSQGIVVIAYSSFGPQSFLELNNPRATGCTPLFIQEDIVKIAKAHGVSPPQVLLRWSTQNNIAVIPKGDSKEMMAENFKSDHFDLTADELQTIGKLDRNLRFNDPWDWAGLPTFY